MQRLRFLLFLFVVLPLMSNAQGKFSAQVFGDYFVNAARDTAFNRANLSNAATGGPKSLQGFVIRRINFTYDYDVNEQFSTRFRIEADGSGGPTGATTTDKKTSFYVKDAWLRWKNVFSGSDVVFGVQPTSAYEVSEAAWGYRSLEKTIMDLRGIVSSRALGASLRGKLDDAGTYNYVLQVGNQGNGSTPKDLSSSLSNGDKYNAYSLMFNMKATKEFQFTLYGDYRPTYPVNDPSSTTTPKATEGNNTLTGSAFLGYAEPDQYSIGVEGFTQMTSHAYTDPSNSSLLKTQAKLGLSAFGWVNLNPTLAAVARFDYYDPKTGSNNAEKGDSRSYILFGLAFKPAKGISVMPNVQIETYEKNPTSSLTYDASVTGRVTVAYNY